MAPKTLDDSKILGPWLTWQRPVTFVLDGLVFLVDVAARLAGLPHPEVPMKYHSNDHRCCPWLMADECTR